MHLLLIYDIIIMFNTLRQKMSQLIKSDGLPGNTKNFLVTKEVISPNKKPTSLKERVLDEVTNLVSMILSWVKLDSSIPVEEIDVLKELWRKQLREMILENYKNLTSFTAWQEWEVYKINLWFKDILLLKRRFNSGAENEFALQEIAYKFSKKSTSWVKVPEPIDCFNNWVDEFILMEYIKWKTLYTMIWQSIVEDILIKDIQKSINKNNDFSLLSELDQYKIQYGKEWKIDFENDSECERAVRELLFIMFARWLIKDNPGEALIDNRWRRTYKLLEKLYKQNFTKVSLFDENQKKSITTSLRKFLNNIHEEWLYHRDLWGNPRNIMFEKKWDNFEVTVIDFGKAEKLAPGSKSLYFDQLSWADYDNDNYIITMINSITWPEEEIEEEVKELDIKDILSKSIALWLDLTEYDIKSNINFLIKRKYAIKSYFDELINWKNTGHWRYIFLKNNLDEFEEKSTRKWKNELFITICVLTPDERKQLENYVKPYLSNPKNTKKHKYAELFLEYIKLAKINDLKKNITQL